MKYDWWMYSLITTYLTCYLSISNWVPLCLSTINSNSHSNPNISYINKFVFLWHKYFRLMLRSLKRYFRLPSPLYDEFCTQERQLKKNVVHFAQLYPFYSYKSRFHQQTARDIIWHNGGCSMTKGTRICHASPPTDLPSSVFYKHTQMTYCSLGEYWIITLVVIFNKMSMLTFLKSTNKTAPVRKYCHIERKKFSHLFL